MPARKPKRSVSADDVGLPEKKSKSDLKVPGETPVVGPADDGLAGASKGEATADPTVEPTEVKTEPVEPVNRWANQDLVRDAVIGYTGDDDEDPPQAGISAQRNSRDIQQMISENADIPIAKDQRANYVWIAEAKVAEAKGAEGSQEIRKKKYTWNAEEIQPVDQTWVESKQIRCDICGALCTEVLYEFRCYRRMRPDEPRGGGRRLHPFVSYISKECGKGLLGLPSGASKLRERIYRLLTDTDGLAAVEELEEVWRLGNDTMRQILADELRFLSRTEAGVPRRAAELRKAEAIHGELHKYTEDVFRAVARATGPCLNARELASITVRYAEEQDQENVAQPTGKGKDGVEQTTGFLGQVAAALHDRKPLPAVPAQWSRADVVTCIQALVNAWRPLRVELHDSLHGVEVFQFEKNSHKQKKRKKEKAKETGPKVSLVYLPGCQELHSISAQSCSREELQALKNKREDDLKQCKEEYAPLEAVHGQNRYSRSEDRSIEIPEGNAQVTFEHVHKALSQITWPNCFTRNNVRPDGAPFIEAFPLGVVLNYALGLVCSRPTRLWPNLTKLLARFIAQEQPDFRYTTVQLNKNYATKMHVDGNNHGPSFIIGLGDYTGGEVWILDEENGTVEVELPCAMRGWPHLRPGQKVKGRLEDCHNKWLKFDGNTPHMTMPYKGSRISIVFFTRKGWLTMLPETKESLECSGFLLPGEDFLNLSTVKEVKEVKEEPEVKEKKVAKAPKVQDVQETAESEDEVDEDEKVDEVMRAEQDAATWPSWNWGSRLRDQLSDFAGTNLGSSNVKVALLGSANVFGMALQELLSHSSFHVVTCTEASGVAMRLMKRTLKPQHAFLSLDAAMAGHGHCDIHHKVCTSDTQNGGSESTKVISEDLLFGSFPCEPFLNQDPARPSCFDDPRSGVFRSLRKHVVVQKPRAALLLAECWQKLPEASRPSVQSFLLDGRDPRIMDSDPEALWGLRHLEGYGAAFVEVPLAACGVPLAGHEAMILLVRDDCGGASAAEAASQLVKEMLKSAKLEPCSVHALMFTDEDPRVVLAQKEAKEALHKGRARRKAQNAAMRRKMGIEIRELGLQPGEAPYTDFLRGMKGAAGRLGQNRQTIADKWIKQTPDDKAVQLNLIFARARQHGLDLQNLCVDLSQGLAPVSRRDDGLLPRPTVIKVDSENPSEFYSFTQHRSVVGQELLLCFGYPIWRLDFRGISDAEATQLTSRSAAVPAVGVCVAAMLAVVELPGSEKIPEKHIAQLLCKVEVKEEKPEVASEPQVQAVQVKTEELPVALDEDGARLESKAAALLNLVSHGAFASRPDDGGPAPPKKREAAKSIFSALSAVAKSTEGEDQTEEKVGTKRKDPEQEESEPMALLPIEEPLDWQVRVRKLTFAASALTPLSLDTVLKWIREAVEDPDADLSKDVIRKGVHEFQRKIAKGEPVPEEMFRSRNELINKLKEADFANLAEEVDTAMRASQLAKGFARGAQQACLDSQKQESMDHYVKTVVRGCDRRGWMMRRVFVHHLSQVAARSLKAGDEKAADRAERSLANFGTASGWPYIISWLKDTPDVNQFPPGEVLDQLGSCLPARCPPQLFAALYVCLTSSQFSGYSAKSLVRIERILAKMVSQAFDLCNVENAMPLVKEIAASGGPISDRFKLVMDLLTVALEVKEAGQKLQSQTLQPLLEKIQDLRAAVALKRATKGWQQLSASEVEFVEELKETTESNLKMALAKEDELRQKHELQKQGQVQEHLEQCRLALLVVVNEDGLKDKTPTGLKRCLAKMKNLKDAMQKVEVPSPFCTEAWNMGREAIQHFSAACLRRSKAFQWLQGKHLGFCARILDTHGLLERLHLIREFPHKLDAVGLPYRCRELLLAAAEKDDLSKDTFAPKLDEVPAGWELNTSRHLNLQYFQKQGGQMQWEWPLPSNLVPWRNEGTADGSTSEVWQLRDEEHALPEAKQIPNRSASEGDACPFVEGGRCLLCGEDYNDEHKSSSAHGQQLKYWKQVTDRMAMVCLDLQKLPEETPRQIGLAATWRGELWQALRVQPAPPKNVLGPFWHRLVLWKLSPSASEKDPETAAGLQQLLREALQAARSCGGQEMKTLDQEITTAIASLEKKTTGLTNISITPAVAALKELRLAVISSSLFTSSSRSPVLDNALKTLKNAEAAIQQYCSEPAFNAVIQSWLREQRLESCFPLLSSRGVLAAIAKGDAVKADVTHGLPTHFSEKLSEAWHPEGLLRLVRPRRCPPDDWELVFSRSVGLYYYCHKITSSRAQWPYPVVSEHDPVRSSLQEVPNMEDCPRGKPVSGFVPYVELDSRGEPICLLCKIQGLEHFASVGHAESVGIWKSVQSRLVDLERDLTVQSTLLTSESSVTSFEMAALAKVWLHDIQSNALENPDSADAKKLQVSRAFWHLLLDPWSSKATRLLTVQQELDRALTMAGLPEPQWSQLEWQARAPPQRDVDFPWPTESTLKLPPSAPPEVYDALSAQALRSEGITAQADGKLVCIYCDKAVTRLSSHLDRRNPEARDHLENASAIKAVVSKLTEEGYQLRCEGLIISKRRFHCGLCNISGNWKWVCDHRSTPSHRDAYSHFLKSSSPAASQVEINSKNFKEAEVEAWKAAFRVSQE